jgi:hypothetical protein
MRMAARSSPLSDHRSTPKSRIGSSNMHTPSNGAVMPPYHHPRLFTEHWTLDAVLIVWYDACGRSRPPEWEDLADQICHP